MCHQRPERSFHTHGARLPVCARCTGLYFSAALGMLAGWIGLASLPRRARMVLLLSASPTAVTWLLEMGGLASPGNMGRAVAALPLGACAGWLSVRLLRADHDRDMRYDPLTYVHQVDRGRTGATRL